MKALKNLEQVHEIQQFYYAEARMLDDRQYQSWIELLAPNIQYTMPNRKNSGLDDSLKNTEAVLNVEQELSSGLEPPLREDNLITLTLRANRPTNPSGWADNPLMRTRRSVSNIEIFVESRNQYKVFNNVLMNYSRHGNDNHLYSFQRQDILIQEGGSFKILNRRIIIDWNIVTAPTMALIL